MDRCNMCGRSTEVDGIYCLRCDQIVMDVQMDLAREADVVKDCGCP
jgi:hypothetical protein